VHRSRPQHRPDDAHASAEEVSRDVTERFDNRPAQIGGLAFSVVVMLLAVSGFIADDSSRIFSALLFLFGLAFGIRSVVSSLVIVSHDGVTTRSFLRTRHFSFSDLRWVDVVVGWTGPTGFRREHLVFHLVNGEDYALRDFNCPRLKRPGGSNVVRQAAESIHRRLMQPEG
jgi:hypothetical protein